MILLFLRGLVHLYLTNSKLSWLKLLCHYLQLRAFNLVVGLQVLELACMYDSECLYLMIDIVKQGLIKQCYFFDHLCLSCVLMA